ncbi:hypothetical protein BH10ACI4_BH10ACI4_28380 [soil metagenome]
MPGNHRTFPLVLSHMSLLDLKPSFGSHVKRTTCYMRLATMSRSASRSHYLKRLSKPHRTAPAIFILSHGRDHSEPMFFKQVLVLRGIKTCMVERFSFENSNRLTMESPRSEHEGGSRGGVCAKSQKHVLLVFLIKMEEAVPGKDALKLLIERQASHIGNEGTLSW